MQVTITQMTAYATKATLKSWDRLNMNAFEGRLLIAGLQSKQYSILFQII